MCIQPNGYSARSGHNHEIQHTQKDSHQYDGIDFIINIINSQRAMYAYGLSATSMCDGNAVTIRGPVRLIPSFGCCTVNSDAPETQWSGNMKSLYYE